MAPAWNVDVETSQGTNSLQQLEEALFLADFCCAVYAQRDPKLVCATAAQSLYEYFRYQQAHFSFAGAEMESVSYLPSSGPDGRERSEMSVVEPFLKRGRSLSFAGSARNPGVDVTVFFPQGFGKIRLVEPEQGKREVSDKFLQTVADCLGSALDKAFEHKRLQELSLRDGLTGLLNRRAFEELLEIEEERREIPPQSVIMIDIDDFKSINDRFGHPAGDQVIARVGGVIKDALRGADLAARYGGEEFAILLPGAIATDAYAISERVRSRVGSLKFDFLPCKGKVTISLGVACRHAKQECGLRDLLTRADEALYQAKRSGKNLTNMHAVADC